MTLENQVMINRLKKQMKVVGINARELSEKANVGKSFVYDILSGKSANPTTGKIQSIADVLGVSLPYLTDQNSNDNQININDYVFISTISIEQKNHNSDSPSDKPKQIKISFRKDWIKKNFNTNSEDIRAIKIDGDYMSPTLQNGDIALVDISKKIPNPPGIYILYNGMGFIAKRLECVDKYNESVVLITSDNINYNSYECKLSETNIIGKIIWFSRAVY